LELLVVVVGVVVVFTVKGETKEDLKMLFLKGNEASLRSYIDIECEEERKVPEEAATENIDTENVWKRKKASN